MKKVFLTLLVALFATVVLGQAKTEIKPANLPKCVLDYVKKNFKDYKIEQAFKMDIKVKGKIVAAYNVCLVKGNEKVWMTFDQNCKAKKITKEQYDGSVLPGNDEGNAPPKKSKETPPANETGDTPKK